MTARGAWLAFARGMPRPTGLTSAAGALRYWERRQELVANNLANVSTDGFKGDRGFARLVGAGTAGESAASDPTSPPPPPGAASAAL